jgi:DNA-binding transcriptional LysR family regulator
MQLAVILDKGTVTGAAQSLLLTQSTLTRNMATLEMQAGEPLFQRSRFGVRSTSLGENLARHGRAIAQQMQGAAETVHRHKLGQHTQWRMGVGPLIGMALMARFSEAFLAQHPDKALSITTGRPLHLLAQLIDGELDAVVAPAVYAQVPLGIDRELLSEDDISIFCAPSHPLASQSRPSIEALGACEWMNVGAASPFQNAELDMLHRSGIKRMRTHFATANDAVILLKTLSKGQHLAVLPRLPVALLRDEYPLVEIEPPAGTARRDLFIWSPSRLANEQALQAMREILKATLEQLGGCNRSDTGSSRSRSAPDAQG